MTEYDVAISGDDDVGTVTASVGANTRDDAAATANSASTSHRHIPSCVNPRAATPRRRSRSTRRRSASCTQSRSANVNLKATFTDPDADQTHIAARSTGTTDARPRRRVNESTKTCTKAHTYNTPGVYTINVTICDNVVACGTADGLVVVYDPTAGFITGGGWHQRRPGLVPGQPGAHRPGELRLQLAVQEGRDRADRRDGVQVPGRQHELPQRELHLARRLGFKAQYKGTDTSTGRPAIEFTLDRATTARSPAAAASTGSGSRSRGTATTVFDNRNGRSPTDMDLANPQKDRRRRIVIHKA